MDLFSPHVPPLKAHPNYHRIALPSGEPVRKVINDWAAGFVDRDGNFEKEFQTKFNQQFWELYLHAVFRNHGFQPNFDKTAPDFQITVNNQEVICEATTTQEAKGVAPEWQRELSDFKPGDNDRIFNYATVRFANSFSSKLSKYRDSYLALPHVPGKPFIIAIGQYEQALFYLVGHIPALRLLFGLDEPLYTFDEGGEVIVLGPAWRDIEIKAGEVELEMGLFRSDTCKEVSGVLCSALATVGKCWAVSPEIQEDRVFVGVRFDPSGRNVPTVGFRPEYSESLTDGLHLFVNPYAEFPVDPQPFRDAGIAVHLYHRDTDTYEFVAPQGTLASRFTFFVEPGEGPPNLPSIPNQLPRPWVVEMPNDRLLWQPVSTALCDEEYIAHYRGWTIHVAKDRYDQDWYGQATAKLVTSIHGIIEASRHGVQAIGPIASEPTKESAWRRVASLIDTELDSAPEAPTSSSP